MAKGFHQSPGIDFFETFSPIPKASTIWVVLSIAVSKGWMLRQLDFNNAFLNGSLDEEVYMYQPPSYEDPSFPTNICKLNKAIYGLKQAPRAWTSTLKSALLSWGFQNSRSDTSLYIYNSGTDVIFLLVYVDDVIVPGGNTSLVNQLVMTLDSKFVKGPWCVTLFLGHSGSSSVVWYTFESRKVCL